MTDTSRRSRCRCRTAFVLCVLATRRCSGFQAPLASVSREHRAVRLSSTLLGEVRPPAQARGAPQGSRLCQGKSRVATAGWSLSLSGEGRGDAVSDGQGQQQQQRPQRENDLTDVRHSQNPRRYMGADAGTSDARGVGGPTGDGRGKEWTVDLCSKRLSLLHRKLRQVKDLLAKQARNPGCLDEHQLVKVERKMDLKVEIAELESLRRDLRNAELSLPQDGSDRRTTTPAKTKGRLPPGPFAGGMQAAVANSGGSPGSVQEGSGARDEPEGGDYDGAGYTREGLKLASPRQRVRASDVAAAAATAAKDAALTRPKIDGEERPLEDSMPVSRAEDNTDTATPSSATEGAVAAALKEEFNWEQSDEDVRQENARLPLLAPEGVKPPAGGYPKRLSTLMSFCRVSDKDTCDILVAMGRVTVNGVVATEPGGRVDVLTDIIVANGIAVTLPEKIDNSDETRRPRADAGKRTGPIPKSEKNTWKAKTKYRWNMDDGLLASRTRKASNAKAFGKKRGGGGSGGYGDDGGW